MVTKTGFLDLLQEIRDLICHQLWKLTPNIHLCVLHMPMLVPLRLMYNLEDGSPILGLAKWLLASMDCFEQGLHQLKAFVIKVLETHSTVTRGGQ
jgi:hypothetical protein